MYTYSSKGDEETKDKYIGDWKCNLKDGIGKQIYSGVGEYNGYWRDNQRHGEGVMIYKNQDIYSG